MKAGIILASLSSPRQLRSAIGDEKRKRSTPIAVGLFLLSVLGYAGTFLGFALVPHWSLKCLLALANGVAIGTLFVIAHDACHGSLTDSKRLNRFIGSLAFIPSMTSFTAWDLSHNRTHHSWTNVRGIDFAWTPLSKNEYDALPRYRQLLQRFYRTALGMGAYYLIENWRPRVIFPSAEKRGKMMSEGSFLLERAVIAVFLLAQHAVLIVADGVAVQGFGHSPTPVLILVGGVWVPFLVWNWLIGFATFLHHTHPRVTWYANKDEWSFFGAQVGATIHVAFPRPIAAVLHNIMEHTAHHLDPSIPLYNLPAGQQQLEQVYPGDVIVQPFTISGFLGIMHKCQLYDYEGHQWLDFSGRPTS